MKISVVSIFPQFFDSPLGVSITARAQEQGALECEVVDPRAFTSDVHRTVDDAPFGGGPGMVMRVEPIHKALESIGTGHRVVLSASGKQLTQADLDRWAQIDHLVLVCGRYEGIDQRVADELCDEEISIGDYVLAGGEAAAAVIIEGVSRLLGGVLGNTESAQQESFRGSGLLEAPHYTRPAEYNGWVVPEVLRSGNHAAIAEWQQAERLARTAANRPDLLPADDSGLASDDR